MSTVDSPVDARERITAWFADFGASVLRGDRAGLEALFLDDAYWRDVVAFTWDLRTFSGRARIAEEILDRWSAESRIVIDEPHRAVDRRRWGVVIESPISLDGPNGLVRGHIRLRADSDGVWRAWTLYTELDELRGYHEAAGANRPRGHSGSREEVEPAGADPTVLVIGAGQAGLSVAARLGALGVPTLVVERHDRIGDNWRKRYQSLVLHNQIWANHLPFLPFPATWPVYIDKDQLADWLESYASVLGIDVETGTEVDTATWDPDAARWNIRITGPKGSRQLKPRQVVMATGVLGPARPVVVPGADDYTGRILHATEYSGDVTPGESMLVVGSGSSAHDIAQDATLAGARVTMLQRSSTCVVSLEPGAARAYAIYREDGAPVDEADRINNSYPLSLVAELHKEMTAEIADLDRPLLEGLRARGFKLDFGEDGSGFLMKHQRYGGGYYINVGASDLIVEGHIDVRQGVEITSADGLSVGFSDGSTAEFDTIVGATGYGSLSETLSSLFGDEIATRVGPVWGLDAESELNAMWRPTGQDGLWVMGGSLQQCRPYSKILALQIKAQLETVAPASPSQIASQRVASHD